MRQYIIIVLFIAVGLLASCGQQETTRQAFTNVTEGTIKAGDPVPVPTENVILSIEGKIRNTNVNNRLDFDLQTLERLGLISYQVDDPDLKRQATYTGVLLARVLEIAGVESDASVLATTALNDYKVDVPLAVLKWPVMIATMRDGQRMSIEEKGPIEIVFPNKSFEIEPIKHNPMWVWQLRFITVR
jgi:hypothetical protein